jgi:hypothetical protein
VTLLFVSIFCMKPSPRALALCVASILCLAALTLAPMLTSAQAQTATVSFTVRITPSAGIAEPVRGLPLYLLRKSFAKIQQEAEAGAPVPDMEKFIDSQKLSKPLIAWMHKHHTVTLDGEDFAKNLTPQEILNIPEFWQAYFQINAGSRAFGFPMPKYDDRDQVRNPAKYQREVDDYHAKVIKYIEQNPDSKQMMDQELDSIDPSPQWNDKLAERKSSIRRTALDWAQSRYMVAQTQTDLNGRAEFGGVPAGTYWISSLNIDGRVGDVEEKWDVPVAVHPGAAMQVVLSNYNAVPTKSIS